MNELIRISLHILESKQINQNTKKVVIQFIKNSLETNQKVEIESEIIIKTVIDGIIKAE